MIGILSFDNNRQIFVLREFHVEGYINQYSLEPLNEQDGVMVFVTEAIENIPPGWRARITYEILNADEFQETFDLAGPEKDWACYITTRFKRQPNG